MPKYVAQTVGPILFYGTGYVHINFDKKGKGNILGDSYTSTSGHPAFRDRRPFSRVFPDLMPVAAEFATNAKKYDFFRARLQNSSRLELKSADAELSRTCLPNPRPLAQGCQIFIDTIYQNVGKCTIFSLNYQMAIKCTKRL
jgi:hypothetical protein